MRTCFSPRQKFIFCETPRQEFAVNKAKIGHHPTLLLVTSEAGLSPLATCALQQQRQLNFTSENGEQSVCDCVKVWS